MQHREFRVDNGCDGAGRAARGQTRHGGEIGGYWGRCHFRERQHGAVGPYNSYPAGQRRLPHFRENIFRLLAKIDVRHSWREGIDGQRLVMSRTRMTLAKPINVIGKIRQTGKADWQLPADYKFHDLRGLRRRLCLRGFAIVEH